MKKLKYIISIIIVFISNSAFSQNCTADYTYNIDSSSSTISFTDLSYISDSSQVATAWVWTVDSDTFSLEQNPIYQYTNLPIVVCLYVDFNGLCNSYFCDTIYPPINPTENCLADFSYTLDSNSNTITFTNTSITYNNIICNFFWNFGDGTSSYDENPIHTYSSPGNYNVCLTINTSSDSCITYTCTVDTCQSIVIPNDSIINDISISGNVYAKTALLPEGIAILYKVETGNYTAISKSAINNGFYIFDNLEIGDYLVYAIPYFGDIENYYPLYYPTYTGNTEHCSDAQIIFVDTIVTKDINLKYNDDINHGFGYISGKVVYDDGSNFETNIFNQNWFNNLKSTYEGEAQNVTILLYNNIGQVIRYELSDENGNFEFKDVPYGLNIIYTEKAGKTTQVISGSLNETNDTIKNILIHIEETEIINIEEITQLNADIYPIPFNNYLNIDINEKIKDLSISIVDITGKQIYYSNFYNTNPNLLKIETNNIKKGSYVMLIKSANSIIFRKKIIK